MIPQDFIDQLLTRVDIVDVVERYVPLKSRPELHGLLPCSTKKPKPVVPVSPSKQFYHCFIAARTATPSAL